MNLRTASLVLLLAAATLGCVTEPEFTYDVPKGPALDRARTLAVDPRALVWSLPGKHTEEPGAYRHAALQELKAKGFASAKAAEADLWLDVIVVGPPRSGGGAPPPVARGGQQGGGGMNAGGRGRVHDQGAPDGGPMVGTGPMGEVTGQGEPTVRGPLTVMIRILSRSDEQVVWAGTVVIPGRRGKDDPLVAPEEWIHRLLQPLPAKNGPKIIF